MYYKNFFWFNNFVIVKKNIIQSDFITNTVMEEY